MKLFIYYIASALFFVILSSCDDEIDSFLETNRYVEILNYTDNEYNNSTIYIGALKDEKFIPTDSLVNNTTIPPKSTKTQTNNAGEMFSHSILPKWNPDVNKVGNISNIGTFYIKLSDGSSQQYQKIFTFPNPRIGNTIYFDIKTDNLTYPDTKETTN